MNIQKITCKENARDNLNIYIKKITAVLHMFMRKKQNRTSFHLFFMTQVYLAAKTENNHYIVMSFVYMKKTS